MQPQYEIVEVVGGGNFGTLCVVRDRANGEQLAVKVLNRKHVDDVNTLQRTRDEARMLHRLNHPNIVQVHHLFEHDGRPVLVMEYVQGCSFEDLVRHAGGKIPTNIALIATMQAARALIAAYSEPLGPNMQPMRIVHRDIKPSNLLISIQGEIKLVDFGIARAEFIGREVKTQAVPRGSMGYSSPEQRMGESSSSPALDVFSLGMTLVYLLTGKVMVLPNRPERYSEALSKQANFVAPEDLETESQRKLRELLCGMCAFGSDDRLSMSVVAETCEALLDGYDVESSLQRFGREWVLPLAERNPIGHPEDHPEFGEVSFIETLHDDVPNVISLTPARIGPDLVDAFIATEGWEARVSELEELVQNLPDWPRDPFLAILRGASKPWWKPWQSVSVSHEEVVAAFRVLNHAPASDSARLASKLQRHENASIVAAAREHLARERSDQG